MYRLLIITVLGLFTGACADVLLNPPVESEAEGLVLTLEASPREISAGDTVRIVARLTNTNPHAVTLNFSSACQILPYVENAAGQIVEPQGGGWGCFQALTSIRLEAGKTAQRIFPWTGQHVRHEPPTWLPVHDPLPAGQYHVYVTLADAELNGRLISLRTAPIPLTLR